MKIERAMEYFARAVKVPSGGAIVEDKEINYFKGVPIVVDAIFSRPGFSRVLDYIGFSRKERVMSLDELAKVLINLGMVEGNSHEEALNAARLAVFDIADRKRFNYGSYRYVDFEKFEGDIRLYRIRRGRE